MICDDYDTKWPSLLPDIVKALTSTDIKGIITGLTALLAFVKKFQFYDGQER